MNAGVEEEGSVEKGRGLGNGSVTGLRKEMTPFSLICGEHVKREVYILVIPQIINKFTVVAEVI